MSDAITVAIITAVSSAILSALTAFFGLLRHRRERREGKEDALKEILRQLANLQNQQNEMEECFKRQRLDLLRIVIVDDGMPISERIVAGREYMKRGGNGDIKAIYMKLKEEADT